MESRRPANPSTTTPPPSRQLPVSPPTLDEGTITMPCMYILECSDGTYYTGSTRDITRRLQEHREGLGANYTRKRIWLRLVYVEEYDRVETAFYREKQVQRWSHSKKKALIEGDMEALQIHAECRNVTRKPSVAARQEARKLRAMSSAADDAESGSAADRPITAVEGDRDW